MGKAYPKLRRIKHIDWCPIGLNNQVNTIVCDQIQNFIGQIQKTCQTCNSFSSKCLTRQY